MVSRRFAAVTSPLGPDVLLLRRMVAREELGRLFECDVELLSPDEAVAFEDILGQSVTVSVELPGGARRHFNGVVSHFSQTGRVGSYASYRAVLRPWLWFLTRVADCRIFQEKTVPDIIKEVFRGHGFTDFDQALSGSYRTWEYCVQYRETDFNFVTRLMEHEGIYYYFRHEAGRHTLVLADSYSSHNPIPGYEQVPYYPASENVVRDVDHLFEWNLEQELQPGSVALNDFDFEKPKAGLSTKSSVQRKHTQADFEIYDYPGHYLTTTEGDAYARARVEELQTGFEQATGKGNARGLTAGGLFRLTDYPRPDQNREYLVVAATHQVSAEAYETRAGSREGPSHSCTFTAIDSRQTYRSPRVTPKPLVQGPQTAIVVGKAGEEIWTDKYGRVKVQFHWDREGKSDEKSSCWVRVAQVWAGKNWGAMHIPRIGQEVIVDFLEGDPDHPIITGRVYNADQMPPYGLPGNQTQSGIKSRSTKQGGADNFNEIRFEDKKGNELLTIHAEKNQEIGVENDEDHSVGRDRRKTIGNDETTDVKANRTESVVKNEKITIGENRTESVGKNEDIKIGENRTENVGKNEEISIGENRTESVGKNEEISIGENRTESVGKNEEISISGNRSENVGKDEEITIGQGRGVSVGKNDTLSVGKILEVTAGDQISLTVGDASIVMKKNGDIVISGKNITIKGSGKINAKADGDLILKGSKIAQN